MSPQRNLALALGTTLAAAVAILLVNWLIDPFALGSPAADRAASLEARATAPRDLFRHKAHAVARMAPAAIILGTSRADPGLSATHAGFAGAAQPAYNLALAGLSIEQMRELLVHAQRTRPLRLAVVGLDLEAFLPGGRTDFDPAVLAGNSESAPAWLNTLRLNLSWRALAASVESFGPPSAAAPSLLQTEGQRYVFQRAELNNFYSRLADLFPRWTPGTRWDAEPRRAAAMRAFRELVSFARRESIDLRLFISPVHARYLELYRRVGWWPMFEAWKQALVATLAEDARAAPGAKPYALWDFSEFNRITAEAVPPRGDLKTVMQWYVDPSHYSPAFGNAILDRVLAPRAQGEAANEIGTLIDAGNIESHLRRVRRDAESYRVASPRDVDEVGMTADFIRRLARK